MNENEYEAETERLADMIVDLEESLAAAIATIAELEAELKMTKEINDAGITDISRR